MSYRFNAPGSSSSPGARFEGFRLPTSNTTYTPNQFFDVCLPHYPRGVIRLVAYILRKTLGWCDAEGNPQSERHRISFNELESEAGISRDMIRSAVDEAVSGHFIRRVQLGAPNRAGRTAQTAEYELLWDERSSQYTKDPARFRGFFAGEGNRTYIPNQFFDVTVRSETLAVVKVVGAVIRFSIGFQNKYGHRRQLVALSYQDIQNYTRIRNRGTLSEALGVALEHNYIQRVEEGIFDPNAGRLSCPATYALKWLNQAVVEDHGRKSVPANSLAIGWSEKRTDNGPKTVPDRRSEKRTDIQIKQINKTLKQQAAAVAFERLRAEGFDEGTAQRLASAYPVEQIERQIDWIGLRKIRTNRLGMLRAAIERDWTRPETAPPRPARLTDRVYGASFDDALQQARHRLFDGSSTSP